MPRFILVLFALGFLIQGCTLQKRTLMPGWHVERVGQASTYADVAVHNPAPDMTTEESVPPVLAQSKTLDPLIPVKDLMAFTPPVEIARALKIQHPNRQAYPHEHPQFDELGRSSNVSSSMEHSVPKRSLVWRILMGLAGLFLSLLGLVVVLLGITFDESVGVVLLGFGILYLARIAFLIAFPKLRERRQARVAARKKKQMAQTASQSKDSPKMAALNEERRRLPSEEKRKRRARRRASLQSPHFKMALGYLAMIALYWLLF